LTRPPENGEQTGGRSEAQRKGIAYQGAFEAVTAVLVAFVLRLLRLGRQLHADEPPETGDADER
jgi:hypothetical protein